MLEGLVSLVVVTLLSLLVYVVKRGLDILSVLAGVPIPEKHLTNGSAYQEDTLEDSIDANSVVSEHVALRHILAQEKADQLRAEIDLNALNTFQDKEEYAR